MGETWWEQWISVLVLMCLGYLLGTLIEAWWKHRRKPPKPNPFKPSYFSIISMEMDIYGVTHYTEDGEYQKPYKAVLACYGPGGEHWTMVDTTWNPPTRDEWEETQRELRELTAIADSYQRYRERGPRRLEEKRYFARKSDTFETVYYE